MNPSERRRHSHSAQQVGSGMETPRRGREDLSSSVDSTYSLLSPIYHDSYRSDEEDHVSKSQTQDEASPNVNSSDHQLRDKERCSRTEEDSMDDLGLTPWEKWLLCKEKRGRIELQRKLAEELKQEEEKLKQQQNREKKKTRAEQQHKEWVRKKNEQERKEKEEKLLKEQQEKELKEHQNKTIQQKSQEKYQEWLRRKKEEAEEKTRKDKEQEEKRLAELREKREKANQVFDEWLRHAKTRPRPTLSSYGYVNGKPTGYYDGSSYPVPGFYNPVPWKPIPVPPPPKEATKNLPDKKKKRTSSSQPYRSNLGSLYKPKDNLHVGGLFKR